MWVAESKSFTRDLEVSNFLNMGATDTMELALRTVLFELREAVILQTKQTAKFKTLLNRVQRTLTNIEPIFHRKDRLTKILDLGSEKEVKMFIFDMKKGKEVVMKCSRIKCWNVYKKFVHANKLIRLDNEILWFFRVEMGSLVEIYALSDKMDRLLSVVNKRAGGFCGCCSVLGLPDVIVGLDSHLREIKRRLLKDDGEQVVAISAPGGCGKTTLAKMLCVDNEVKGYFGDNIFYVTVSRTTSLKTVIQKLFAHLNVNHYEFRTDEEAKNQLEYAMSQMGSGKILLVLDDVWSETESVIRDLKFSIPGFKILVTSRCVFLGYGSTYELSLLNDEDARTLLCKSAFPVDGNPVYVPDDLVSKMVKCCKGFPLALTVVGASLCGQGVLKWRTTLKKWSEGQSIFDSDNRLFLSLRASVDALEQFPIARDCFLDMGSFPENEKIAASALMDLWVVLYNLDEEGMYTSEYLLELSSRNLLRLDLARNDASELEGYCNEHYVTQHDLLRELSIHMSRQEPIPQRKRLLIEIHGNEIPRWWIEQIQQPIAARLLSISTDESFSSNWCPLQALIVEVLILNIRSKNYTLPHFIENMKQLKAVNITSYGIYPSQLHELALIGTLSNLKRIRFEHVSLLPSIQSVFHLNNLQKLSFITCEIGNAFMSYNLDSHPMLPNLVDLEIDRCYDLKELPPGLCNLNHLKKLSITNCHELDFLPQTLGSLLNLETLRLHSCTKLAKLPVSIGNLRNLIFLDISDCLSISSLPDQIGELNGLRVLKMSGCFGLEELPSSVTNLSLLEDVICDEETSYLWSCYESELRDLKINVVEDDPFANFKKIVAP